MELDYEKMRFPLTYRERRARFCGFFIDRLMLVIEYPNGYLDGKFSWWRLFCE